MGKAIDTCMVGRQGENIYWHRCGEAVSLRVKASWPHCAVLSSENVENC